MVTAIGLLELAAALREVRHLMFLGGLGLRLTIESFVESSPIRYEPSSSPGRTPRLHSDLRSESSGLFVGSSRGTPYRRGDINSDTVRTPRAPRRVILDESGRVMREGQAPGSDAASFVNRDPNTSEADILGGPGQSLIWGTTVSIDDTFSTSKTSCDTSPSSTACTEMAFLMPK